MPTESGCAAATKTRVLVVEDDRSSRSALMALLRLTGFDPLPAGSVAEGLQQLDRSPHCLILDLMLPDGNGSSILAHVRRNKLPISVAVTTGAIDWAEMLQESSEPPNAVFSKPLNFKSIIDWLRDCEQSIQ